jgi:GntR family transcriptional regulator, galactonate operon transcriptional repressor
LCTHAVNLSEHRLYPSAALHGRVAHEIGRQIVSGAIAEGDFLPKESELSERFSVSRQAIREALKVLAAKGLVTSRRRAGTYVMPRAVWNLLDPDILAWHPPGELSPAFLNDLIELRRMIEPVAARFAAVRGTPENIERIGVAVEKMRRTLGNPREFYAADVEFHFALFAASGNTLIDSLSTILAPVMEASFRLQGKIAGLANEAAQVALHASVYDAIVAGDPVKASGAMEEILADAATTITRIVVDRAEPTG